MAAKLFTSLYCVLVAAMLFYTQQTGAAILNTAVSNLEVNGFQNLLKMGQYVDNPLTMVNYNYL